MSQLVGAPTLNYMALIKRGAREVPSYVDGSSRLQEEEEQQLRLLHMYRYNIHRYIDTSMHPYNLSPLLMYLTKRRLLSCFVSSGFARQRASHIDWLSSKLPFCFVTLSLQQSIKHNLVSYCMVLYETWTPRFPTLNSKRDLHLPTRVTFCMDPHLTTTLHLTLFLSGASLVSHLILSSPQTQLLGLVLLR